MTSPLITTHEIVEIYSEGPTEGFGRNVRSIRRPASGHEGRSRRVNRLITCQLGSVKGEALTPDSNPGPLAHQRRALPLGYSHQRRET
jgi:hypothetical protein